MSNKDWYARHLNPQPAPAAPQQRQNLPAPVQPQVPQQYPQQQQQMPQVTSENLIEAVGHSQGGEATATETQRCPKCGGNHYFSRSQGAHRGPPPAPMCYDCNYNGMFEQGDPATWGSA